MKETLVTEDGEAFEAEITENNGGKTVTVVTEGSKDPYAFLFESGGRGYRDAMAWTKEYVRLHGDKPATEENLFGWFANAIEAQHLDKVGLVNTEEAKAFDAEAFISERCDSMRDGKPIVRYLSIGRELAKELIETAYEAGKREAVSDGVVNEVKFLIDRLEDFENEHVCDDDAGRDWFGHVTPSVARLRAMLSASPKAGE